MKRLLAIPRPEAHAMERGGRALPPLLGTMLLLILVMAPTAASATCPNESTRTGASAALPDCRAYELVTPPDTNGRLLEVISTPTMGQPWNLFPTELGSPVRDSFVYESYAGGLKSPSGAGGAFDVYQAERTANGWQTAQQLTLPATTLSWPRPGGVAADHSYSFAEEQRVTYLRNPDGSFELLGSGELGDEPYVRGLYISPGGNHLLFTSGDGTTNPLCAFICPVKKLEADAPPTGTAAIYDRGPDGPTHVVSLLPGDIPPGANQGALFRGTSKDAETVAFSLGGILYARVDNGGTDEKTLMVAEADPAFAGISEEGRYVFYVAGGDSGTIHRFDTTDSSEVAINPGGPGEVVNISSDGSHTYFASQGVLTGTEQNEQGEAAQPPASGNGTLTQDSNVVSGVSASEGSFSPGMHITGTGIPAETTIVSVGSGTLTLSRDALQSGSSVLKAGFPNLYVWTGGSLSFIATVAAPDLYGTPALTNWTDEVFNSSNAVEGGPGADSSRATPNGSVFVFESSSRLTSYDNDGHLEIYRYEAGTGHLECVSCNPRFPVATADSRLQETKLVHNPIIVHNLSEDGARVFFETTEALSERDVNGDNDIYEWQEAGGSISVDLISSGQEPDYPIPPPPAERVFQPLANMIYSITPDGSDVYFTAKEALVPGAGEGGTQAIYDARVDGGFPTPVIPKFCIEEACRPAGGSSPSYSPPTSEHLVGGGNVKPPKRHCRHARGKGKKKGRRSCSGHHRRRSPRARLSSADAPPERAAPAQAPSVSPDQKPQLQFESAGSGTGTVSLASPEDEYGFEKVEAHTSTTNAGMHPDFTTNIVFKHFKEEGKSYKETPSATAEDITVSLPPGLLGNPLATPRCSMGDFVTIGNCPVASQVGVTNVHLGSPSYGTFTEPIFNLTPPHPHDEVARLGFIALLYPVFIDVRVRTAGDFGVTATVHSAPGLGTLVSAETTLWGDPASPVHDEERITPIEARGCGTACLPPGGRPSGIPPEEQKGFMTNPSACQGGQVGFEVTTYQHPGEVLRTSAPFAPTVGCTGLPFAPTFEARPTTRRAGAPTGLQTVLRIPQHLGPQEAATSTMREARVSLPAGMQIAPGAANWVQTCSDQQVHFQQEVDAGCPDASKLGTATFASPALSEPLTGAIYQRTPSPGHQFGLWLVSDALGLHIKLPGEIEPDPDTGRLTAVFRDLPQVPVEEIELDVWGGPRAPLKNPDACGIYTTDFTFAPHSEDSPVSGQSQMSIDEGCDQPFAPKLSAGVEDPRAGAFSPFVFDLLREDGDQALRGFELKLPDGELAKLAGVPLCPDAAAAAGSCPADSRIGSLSAISGPGPNPLAIPQPGKAEPAIYLGGPYLDAPFSIVSEVPAQAGPFDLGVVVVRSALDLDPDTSQAVVKADPLPQFVEGVAVAYRRLHAIVDRPGFSLNPTDCREQTVTAKVSSTAGAVANPSARFQVDGCKGLKFRPDISLKLKGGSERSDYPALTAVLKAKQGDANIDRVSVGLPHSEFLAQEHIGTICTRVQFAAAKCPARSVYGKAKAWTPLLDQPLQGPVYLRSSNHPLPDLVVALGGQLEVNLVGRIDSHGGGIRTTFESVPDAPVRKFVLQMKGGDKGLLTNSTDICEGTHRATIRMRAQNGRVRNSRAVLEAAGCGKGLHKQHNHR
jgi:hypothetical protein